MAPIVTANDFDGRFLWGVGSSAYQVEGAAKEGGRGEGIWDAFAHQPGNIKDGSNGDVSADQYHRYNDDLDLMAELGFTTYHFSISWSRIYTDGSIISAAGVAYYDNLINAIIKRKMTPCATLFHWDFPNYLQTSRNGWSDGYIVHFFKVYAATCFTKFGDRVMQWITIYDPLAIAINGYGTGIHAPGRKSTTDPYKVAFYLLLAHADVVNIYRSNFKHQGGEIGIALGCQWGEPHNWNKPEDVEAAKRHMSFQIGWFLNPIVHGVYPEDMLKLIGDRLPLMTIGKMLKGSIDFLGINHYRSRFIAHHTRSLDFFERAQQIEVLTRNSHGQSLNGQQGLYLASSYMHKLLRYITTTYDKPKIYITGNGMADEDGVNAVNPTWMDYERSEYFEQHLAALSRSINQDQLSNVKGYFVRSFLDGFEWEFGYTKRFGLVSVDRQTYKRTPKYSAMWWKDFLKIQPQLPWNPNHPNNGGNPIWPNPGSGGYPGNGGHPGNGGFPSNGGYPNTGGYSSYGGNQGFKSNAGNEAYGKYNNNVNPSGVLYNGAPNAIS